MDKNNEAVMSRQEWRTTRRNELHLPYYTLGEEIANAITHGLGAVLSLAAIAVLSVLSFGRPQAFFSVIIYGAALLLLYLISTLYHALGVNRAKRVFQVFDHCSIFLLIAGTYTPICLLVLGGTTGTVVLCIAWTAAIVGIVLTAVDMKKFRVFSMTCYISMGWCIIFVFGPLMQHLSSSNIVLLVLGGVAYTVGAVIFGLGRKIRYMHSLWHLFVLLGSALHFVVILNAVR
jgi:channel protein, hemolysin III family